MLPNPLLLDVVSFLRSETLAVLRLSNKSFSQFILTRLYELPKRRVAVYVTSSVPPLNFKVRVGRRSVALHAEQLSTAKDAVFIQILYFAYGLTFRDELLEFLDGLKLRLRTAKCVFYTLPSTVSACRSLFSNILHCRAMHFHVEQDREHALWPALTLPCIQACEELVVSGPRAVDFVLQSKAIEWLNGDGPKLLRWDLTNQPFDLQRNTASKFDDLMDGLKKDFSAATEATQYEVIVVALHSVRPAFLETNGTTKERLASSVRSTEFHIKRELSSIPSSIN